MIDVPVTSAMTREVRKVSATTSTADVATKLRKPAVPAVLVGAADGSVDGIVTESDVVAVVAERGERTTVGSLMSSPVVSCKPTTPVGLAADRMRDAGVAVLPVTDESGCQGLVTRNSIAPYVSRHRLDIEWNAEPLRLDTP